MGKATSNKLQEDVMRQVKTKGQLSQANKKQFNINRDNE